MVLETCEKYIATETVKEDSTDTVDGLDIKEPKTRERRVVIRYGKAGVWPIPHRGHRR